MTKSIDQIKPGDIFYCSWGYDQTNIDFYQVIKRTAKMITVRRIGRTSEPAWTMACYVMPVKDAFLDSGSHYDQTYGKPLTRRLGVNLYGEPCFKPESYSMAWLWNGERKTETSTG